MVVSLTFISGEPASASAFVVSKNLCLWYRQPAVNWSESLFIGNGRLGGAVWGGVQRGRIDLNEETLCSGEPYENINPNSLPALPEIRRLLLAGKELEAQQMVESKMLGRYNENCFSAGGIVSVTNPVNPPGQQTFYRSLF